MPHNVASDLGMHCLPMTFLQVSIYEWVNVSVIFVCRKLSLPCSPTVFILLYDFISLNTIPKLKTHLIRIYIFGLFLKKKKISFYSYTRLIYVQSTLVISKSKGPAETLGDNRTSTYQMRRIEENSKRTTKFHK